MIDLLIADDHPVVREGLKRILSDYPDMQVVDEATTGDEVLAKSAARRLDVILLDISMPGPGFLETLRRLRGARPDVRILVLSVHPEEHYAVRALQAGAGGYLSKDRSPGQLAEAIRHVHRGGKYVTPSLAESLALRLEGDPARPAHESLSEREYEVLCQLGTGKSVKEIAHDLKLSPKTVSTYRTRLLRKMRLDGTADLVRYVIEHGLAD